MNRITAYCAIPLVALVFVGCGGDDNGPSCGDGTVDTPEECDDGNTASGDGCDSTCLWEGPAPQTVSSTINCCLGATVATCPDGSELPLPFTITVDLAADVTNGATVDYTAQVDSTLSATLGDIIIGFTMADTFDINGFSFDLASAGATPAIASFDDPNVPRTVDVDANDDGMAEAAVLSTGRLDGSLTHDGAATDVTLSFGGMVVDIMAGALPVTLTVPTADPAPVGTAVYCDLPDPADTTITIPVP